MSCPHFLIMVHLLMQRIRIEEIRKDSWFKKNYAPVRYREDEEVNLDDVNAVFNDIEVGLCSFVYCSILA